jgi:hypothetical protein
MSNLDFSQGFTKSGQLVSQYGGFEPTYDGNKNKRIKIDQADKLITYIANKYSKVSKLVREKWRDEMLNMDGFEYMNVDFLAAALDLYENNYSEDEEIEPVFANVFKSDYKMDRYYDLLIINKKKLSEEEYLEKKILTKQILYSYIIKLHYYRKKDKINDKDNIIESKKPYPSREI